MDKPFQIGDFVITHDGRRGFVITIDPRFSFVVHHQVLLTSRKKHHYSANNIRLAGFEPTADECAVLMKHMLLDY
jgi:hypothetical protein